MTILIMTTYSQRARDCGAWKSDSPVGNYYGPQLGFVERWHDVIYEAGAMHGPADCFRESLDTRKQLAIFANYTYDIAGRPDWVKTLKPSWGYSHESPAAVDIVSAVEEIAVVPEHSDSGVLP